jgi:DNA polymerase-3 subunit epsilon
VAGGKAIVVRARAQPLPTRVTVAELEAHAQFIASLGDKAIWREYDPRP